MASALLSNPTGLAPLTDMGLHVEFRTDRGGVQTVPVPLTGARLADREVLVTAVPKRFPRRVGTWTATWKLGDLVLATQQLRAVSQRHFERSLRVSEARFAAMTTKGDVLVSRQPPALAEMSWVRPCFLISSTEPGMAGMCTLRVRAQSTGSSASLSPIEQEALVTDVPAWFAPGTEDVAKLGYVNGFELCVRDQVLSALSMSPVPAAVFSAEGGFRPPAEFAWSPAADEELNDRLARLVEKRPGDEERI
jgi:hypothetical protein